MGEWLCLVLNYQSDPNLGCSLLGSAVPKIETPGSPPACCVAPWLVISQRPRAENEVYHRSSRIIQSGAHAEEIDREAAVLTDEAKAAG